MSRGWITGATVQGAASVLSVILAGAAFTVSVKSCQATNQTDKEAYASKVFLSEGPSTTADWKNKANVWVYNASGSPIFGVWVEGDAGRVTKIYTIAPCEMYELQPNFPARALYFKDPKGKWRRDEASQQLSSKYREMPEQWTDHTRRTLPIPGCR